jgi:nucleoside 2-deoxyribosyltransferase
MARPNRITHTPIVYLASPIDNGVLSGVDKVRELLVQDGYAVYWPQQAWQVHPGAIPTESLQAANLAVLDMADGMIACLKPDKLSVGTVLEIIEARMKDIPVIVWGQMNHSWALAYLNVESYADLRDAVRRLEELINDRLD